MIPESRRDLLIPTVIPRAIDVIWNSCGPPRINISDTYITVITNTISLTYSYSCNCTVVCSYTGNYIMSIISVKLHVKIISGMCSDTCRYM